jgi:hypothetical protein
MPTMAPRPADEVVGDQGRAGAGGDRSGDAVIGVAHHVAADGDIAQILPPAGGNAGVGRVLDHVGAHQRVGFDADADPGIIVRIGAGGPLREAVSFTRRNGDALCGPSIAG